MSRYIRILSNVVDKYGQDKLFTCFDCLKAILPRELLQKLIPDEIGNPFLVEYLFDLEKSLTKLKECKNFDSLLQNLSADFRPHSFTLDVASYLYDGCKELSFEPLIESSGKRADLLVEFKSQKIILECKSPTFEEAAPSIERQAELNHIARQFLPPAYQIHFYYREDRGNAAFTSAFKQIAETLSDAATSGLIFNEAWLYARIEDKQEFTPGAPVFITVLAAGQFSELLPGHAFYQDGYTLAFLGPLTDLSNPLKKKMKRSAEQADPQIPFLSVINSEALLGERAINVAGVLKEFTPRINKRISGVMLFEKHMKAKGMGVSIDLILNPHAARPIESDIVETIRA